MQETHFNLYKISKNVLFALTAFSLVACTTAPSEPPKNTEHWATLISEQENLYQIDNKFYRSEQLEAQSEALLNKLNIHRKGRVFRIELSCLFI